MILLVITYLKYNYMLIINVLVYINYSYNYDI
jgi:hypothetical protein